MERLTSAARENRGVPVLLLVLIVTLFCTSPASAAAKITAYRPIFKPCRTAGGILQVAIRQYQADGVSHVLLVNPATLETSIEKTDTLSAAGRAVTKTIPNSPFAVALERYTSLPCKLQNHGATRSSRQVDGLFLTVDMCPSKRAFEREMFATVADLSRKGGGPVPIAVAMTGAWLERHRDDLAWLKGEVATGKLAITWINHSYSHPYEPKVPLTRNFLLTPGVNFEREVLSTEVLLLENGLVPSPFFRFPGLVADGRLLTKLRELSLIPIGSDAWLAKGESPQNGSFILVHGNGNEPQGIRKLLPLLREEKPLRLLPLREAFAGKPAPRYAVAEMATPVLNTPGLAAVFGGRDGRTLQTDNCGQLRAMEFVALPGTVFTLEGEQKKGKLLIYRVTTADYPYPAKKGYFIDSRLVGITEKKTPERPRQVPPKETVIASLLAAKGSRYVWGGNVRNGLPQMLSLYPPAGSAPLSSETAAMWQLHGVDCSGLLYEATGGFTPRNTGALIDYGTGVEIAGLSLERIIERVEPLDLIVWQGHVIIILDRERTIESRLDCGGKNGGVVVRPLKEALAGVMKKRIAVDSYGDAAKRGKKGFVIRRWYGR